ncbi:aminotransferase class I/II-fold pyridoxal phosphate-dependent enzyme [Microbacterium sp. zg.Y625]|uniref:MalY/PatB family protein n=1 Tax=Microbacterium jiangjiandongii TaxID=3049071 RepID=UPI00214C1BDE|nr:MULTISPECIES: aminotransferase class I/II-fold pyridoxal phosphate-dependent enzyme [unclassified Microbacterium]MCR2794079.1 aminotransferase class I/II-fold pyridoxal phosphate-dependent enzyme [Microbacterium sp. zg.Y625]WIM25715.1 aminotransferase class I/II-fold pyridoxal phosphate-dependent enzyme [Microbacterium sp. zg-Y625]
MSTPGHPDFDAITEDDLRAAGSVKWTTFPDTIGAFVAEMDFGLAPAINDTLTGALDRGLTGYLPAQVAGDMAAATADWYADTYGWAVPAERVHHVPDVIAAFELAIEKFTRPGSAIIVPTPAYMPFLFVPQLHGREVIEVPSVEIDGRMTMDLDAIGRAFDDGAGMVVVCNPHNPLGTVFRRDELVALSEVVAAKGGRVFSDEIHAPLVYRPATHVPYASVSDAAAAHTLTAASASKAWNLAGLKCAQVILSNDTDADAWETFGPWAGHGTSTLGALANTTAYRAGAGWLEDVRGYLDGNRHLLADLLAEHAPRARMILPEGTYIALIDFRAYGIEGDLGEWFRGHARVAMTDGAACGQAAVGHVRFVFALPRPLLREAVSRIGRALDERAAGSDAA